MPKGTDFCWYTYIKHQSLFITSIFGLVRYTFLNTEVEQRSPVDTRQSLAKRHDIRTRHQPCHLVHLDRRMEAGRSTAMAPRHSNAWIISGALQREGAGRLAAHSQRGFRVLEGPPQRRGFADFCPVGRGPGLFCSLSSNELLWRASSEAGESKQLPRW